MSKTPRCSEVIGLKVPTELAEKIRRQARQDDRTVSGYLRRVLAVAVQQAAPKESLTEDKRRG